MIKVYAYRIVTRRKGCQPDLVDKIYGLYTEEGFALKEATTDSLFALEENSVVPLSVYENEEELPECVSKKIRPYMKSYLQEVLERSEDEVFAVLHNMDPTEGKGPSYVDVLTTDPLLANKIGHRSGPSGSHSRVIVLKLNSRLVNVFLLAQKV